MIETDVYTEECSRTNGNVETVDKFINMASTSKEIPNSAIAELSPKSDVDTTRVVECEDAFFETLQEQQTIQKESSSSEDDDISQNLQWLLRSKHIFVLSSAGKPIYSRYGNEDKLATIFATMQALVSVVQDNDDTLQTIIAGDTTLVFLVKTHIILVAVSKTIESKSKLTMQLNYVYDQIASMLTITKLNKIFEQRHNYDLRRLLSGVERLIDHLLLYTEVDPAFTLAGIECLPLTASARDSISSAITQCCSKIKNVVFAILVANNQLVTLVRMKKYDIHPTDLHLIFNLVKASQSFKAVESWTPLCLPRFDCSGFLYGHVSYLAEDCQACLILLTVERDVFPVLSVAKQKIVEKLRRNNCLEAINDSLQTKPESCRQAGFPELRHFLYKSKSTSQFYQPAIGPPYLIDRNKLLNLYKNAHDRLHTGKSLKFVYDRSETEVTFSWNTHDFELYAILEPIISTETAISIVTKLSAWIKKKEDMLFQLNVPTF